MYSTNASNSYHIQICNPSAPSFPLQSSLVPQAGDSNYSNIRLSSFASVFLYARTFTWNSVSSWGTMCGSTTKDYHIYYGKNLTSIPTKYLTISHPTTFTTITLSESGNYSWWIRTFNGQIGTKKQQPLF